MHRPLEYDTIIQALSGIMDATGAGPMVPQHVSARRFRDIVAGRVYAYAAIVTALADSGAHRNEGQPWILR